MYEQSAGGQWSPKNNISVYYLQKHARAKQSLHLTLRMILKTEQNEKLQVEHSYLRIYWIDAPKTQPEVEMGPVSAKED